MAYKLFIEKNWSRRDVSALEFQLQHYNENNDKLALNEIKRECKQLIEKAKAANAMLKSWKQWTIISISLNLMPAFFLGRSI